MGIDYQVTKKHCFSVSFFSKAEPIILSIGGLILIKKSLILLVEHIF